MIATIYISLTFADLFLALVIAGSIGAIAGALAVRRASRKNNGS